MYRNINMSKRFKYSLNPGKLNLLIKDKVYEALLYLLIISIILGSVQGVFYVASISITENLLEITLSKNELKFQFTKGALTLNEEQWKDDEGESLIYINTNIKISEIEEVRSIYVHKNYVLMFLNDGFMIKNNSVKNIYSYKDVGLGNATFNNEEAIKYIEYISIGKYLIIPLIILIKYVKEILYAFLCSIFAEIYVLINGLNLRYKNIFVLSIYSLTIPSIIGTIFIINSYEILIAIIILFISLSKVKEKNRFN